MPYSSLALIFGSSVISPMKMVKWQKNDIDEHGERKKTALDEMWEALAWALAKP